MAEGSHEWRTNETRDLFETILSLRTVDEAERFFRDLCTLAELEALTHRWQAARLLDEGRPYLEVARDGRVDDDGDAGRAVAQARRGRVSPGARPAEAACEPDRLKIAVPAKGRLREPSVALLEDAGLGPEQPGERALAFPCRNAPVDVLLVRAADVPEYVQDGVVDCGITGADLVRERGAEVEELLRLGFGACTLEAAVPTESRGAALDDLDGLRVATVYPRLARELLGERGISVELVEVTGSVEVAPRLGLADAIVDLVSSGSTLRTNGLRSLGSLFSSEAVLVARRRRRPRRELATVLRSVVQARETRYLMLNAPESALEEIARARPGLGLAERAAARRARDGRDPRARARRRRLAASAAARGGRRLVDPARARRADAALT